MKLVFLDDVPSLPARRIRQVKNAWPAVVGSADMVPLKSDDAVAELTLLLQRQRAYRDPNAGDPQAVSKFDDATAVFLDYDLAHFDTAGGTTGHDLSYLVRLTTTAGCIVLMNRRDTKYFDLSLVADRSSFADQEIGSQSLTSSALWGQLPKGFAPWHWRDVNNYGHRISELSKRLLEFSLDTSIFECLRVEERRFEMLPTIHLAERTTTSSETPATLLDILRHPATLRPQERELALREELPRPVVARILAARIISWLERYVARVQQHVLDAPHLVMTYPSALEADQSPDDVVSPEGRQPSGVSKELGSAKAESLSDLLGRALWWRTELRNSPALLENSKPWTGGQLSRVFCEDTSTFREHSDTDVFRSSLGGPLASRYCASPRPEEKELSSIRRFPLDALD